MQDLEMIRVIARYVGPVCGDDEGKPGDSRDHPGDQSIGKDEVRVVQRLDTNTLQQMICEQAFGDDVVVTVSPAGP
jgi:hypothetical protein